MYYPKDGPEPTGKEQGGKRPQPATNPKEKKREKREYLIEQNGDRENSYRLKTRWGLQRSSCGAWIEGEETGPVG